MVHSIYLFPDFFQVINTKQYICVVTEFASKGSLFHHLKSFWPLKGDEVRIFSWNINIQVFRKVIWNLCRLYDLFRLVVLLSGLQNIL
jgi:hypothetical protein